MRARPLLSSGALLARAADVIGTDHADTLIGTGGSNVLNGGGGNDVVEGRGGSDDLEGGSGTDTLDLSAAGGRLTVDLTAGTASGMGEDEIRSRDRDRWIPRRHASGVWRT